MIGMLRGQVIGREGDTVLLDVSGVGYEVHAPARTLEAWSSAPDEVTVIVHTQVREDAITLYGFESPAEKKAFRVLLGVNKVGAKIALAALEAFELPELVRAVETDDVKTLCRISGVGKRTAQRLALELKGKLPAAGFSPTTAARTPASRAPAVDAFALALERLGWSKAEIEAARARVIEAGLDDEAPVGQRVRVALQSSLRS